MKRYWVVAAGVTTIVGLTACEPADGPAGIAPPDASERAATAPAAGGETTFTKDVPAAPEIPATDGAPAFAVLYPGGSVEGEPVAATGPGGPGGLVTYLTDADPEAVISFHRARAEAAGLASVMAMNQGEARAYGAARDQDNLQVVASPTPEGRTSVQLSWSAAG